MMKKTWSITSVARKPLAPPGQVKANSTSLRPETRFTSAAPKVAWYLPDTVEVPRRRN